MMRWAAKKEEGFGGGALCFCVLRKTTLNQASNELKPFFLSSLVRGLWLQSWAVARQILVRAMSQRGGRFCRQPDVYYAVLVVQALLSPANTCLFCCKRTSSKMLFVPESLVPLTLHEHACDARYDWERGWSGSDQNATLEADIYELF